MSRIHERLTKTKGKTYWFIIDVGRDDTGENVSVSNAVALLKKAMLKKQWQK